MQSDNAAEPCAVRTVLAVTFLHQFLEPGVYYFHSIMSREIHLEIHVHACQYCTVRPPPAARPRASPGRLARRQRGSQIAMALTPALRPGPDAGARLPAQAQRGR